MKIESMHISVVVPSYKCQECLIELYDSLVEVLDLIGQDYEIILVDDRSPEKDWHIIKKLCKKDSRVRGVRLSRNFGQHYAISAGLDVSKGDWVVVMDCDLQDKPEHILSLYKEARKGFHVVLSRRIGRKDGILRRKLSDLNTGIYNFLSGYEFDNKLCNFSICSRLVIESMKAYKEKNRSYLMLLLDTGFTRKIIDLPHGQRFYGDSSYDFSRLLNFAIDSLVSRSNKLLFLSFKTGLIICVLVVLYAIWIVSQYLMGITSIPGWRSLMIINTFLFGIVLVKIGLLGLYTGKIFDEVKQRPLYFVEETIN